MFLTTDKANTIHQIKLILKSNKDPQKVMDNLYNFTVIKNPMLMNHFRHSVSKENVSQKPTILKEIKNNKKQENLVNKSDKKWFVFSKGKKLSDCSALPVDFNHISNIADHIIENIKW